ncbi:MAG: 1-(5-phosphoribosyl)-5-amino-4-imidazole-carboxylate carboxylase [Candidatus Melainabacteria bacterium RIFOXYA2_FULL_32_9]|nr:MAG: 1-(5-phosphoribosyl)-5-amino-4-imidazole-carboxylate carboxylase [Candidatus Melainabacteria bacterium RIFOXYA2_FULL_32_9]
MQYLRDLLEEYKNGLKNLDEVIAELKVLPYKDIDFAKIDHHRTLRQGFPEVIYCPGKENNEIVAIIAELKKKNRLVIATRADKSVADYVLSNLAGSIYHKKARIISYGEFPEKTTNNYALVISAGTADLPVAEEAVITLKAAGIKTETIFDCGVAGVHRIFNEIDKIQNASAIIVIAGMEGALASFVGGISGCPVIAVPTSIGYGANFEGITTLLSMLNSCASCVSVVNIDNGFGAANIASMIVKQSKD